MPNALQTFLAAATQKAADSLIAAVENLPEDKRGWRPFDKGRSALDQAAECAILNGTTAELLVNRAWPEEYSMDAFQRRKEELAQDWNRLKALLLESTTQFIGVMQAVPEGDMDVQIALRWGPTSLAEIMAYPYWNMSYHEGQTNYIASML